MIKLKILIIWSRSPQFKLSSFLKKGNDITIFARGKPYENLQNNGLMIKHKFGHQTIDHFKIIKKLLSILYNTLHKIANRGYKFFKLQF